MPSMFLLFSSFAFFISSIDETPPEIITGIFEVFAIFSVIVSGAGASIPNLFVETTVSFNYFSTTMDKTKLFLFIILLSGTTLPLFSLNLYSFYYFY